MRMAAPLLVAVVLAGCFSSSAVTQNGVYAIEATTLVWAKRPALRVDLVASPGITPAGIAITALMAVMDRETEYEHIAHHATTLTTMPSDPDRAWTTDELRALVAAHRATAPPDDTTVFHVFYLEGTYPVGTGETGSAFGLEVQGAIIMLNEPISPATREADDRFERAILIHELGHALGLVDNGAPLTRDRVNREDPCECHSTNTDSIMSSSPELGDLGLNYLGVAEMPWQFDDDDLADLAALRAIPHERLKHRT